MLRGKILGIPVAVSGYSVMLAVFLLWRDRSQTVVWGFLAAGMHELGHIWMIRRLKCEGCEVRLTLCGLRILRRDYGYQREVWINLAGGAVNLCAAIGSGLLLLWVPAEGLAKFFWAQILMGGLNLLPIYPLDGGQALFDWLCGRMEVSRAERIVNWVAFCILFPLATGAMVLVFQSRVNISLLGMVVTVIILLVLKEKH